MSEYIILDGTKIKDHMSGPLPEGDNIREIPLGWDSLGCDIREYDKDMRLRPLADRIADKLVILDSREKVDGEHIVPKSQAELVRDVLEPRPKGAVVDVDSQGEAILRPASLDEQVALGDLTAEVAYSLKLEAWEIARKMAYVDDADPVYMMIQRGEINEQTGKAWTMGEYNQIVKDIKARLPKPETYA